MTGIVVLIVVGLVLHGICRTIEKSASDEGPKCSVCGTTKRSLQWMKSWEDWFCWPCKEESIHVIVNSLIEGHA